MAVASVAKNPTENASPMHVRLCRTSENSDADERSSLPLDLAVAVVTAARTVVEDIRNHGERDDLSKPWNSAIRTCSWLLESDDWDDFQHGFRMFLALKAREIEMKRHEFKLAAAAMRSVSLVLVEAIRAGRL